MSYCVNCGVKLADSEKECPLCGVEVINPLNRWHEPDARPYPQRVERILGKSERRFAVSLLSIFLLIPIIIPLITDLLYNGGVTWSGYVIGGGICVFFWVLFPLLFENPRIYLYWLLDFIVGAGYIASIAHVSGGRPWFLALGLPLSVSAGAFSLACVFIFSSAIPKLYKLASFSLLIAALTAAADFIISAFVKSPNPIHWSFFAAVPFVIFAAAFTVTQRRKKLLEQLRKRLFY